MKELYSLLERSERLQRAFESVQREIEGYQTRLRAHRRALASLQRLQAGQSLSPPAPAPVTAVVCAISA